jgi:excisionase family DNA binding protein
MKDLSQWLTIDEAATRSGRSRRTIERLIAGQKIITDKRPIEGHSPITVLDPDEVDKLRAQVLRPVVQSDTPSARQTDIMPVSTPARQADIGALLTVAERVLAVAEGLRVPVVSKRFLSFKEAGLYLGFPTAEVKRLVKSGTLPAVRLTNRQWRIARQDLDHYNPPPVTMADWRTNGVQESTAM